MELKSPTAKMSQIMEESPYLGLSLDDSSRYTESEWGNEVSKRVRAELNFTIKYGYEIYLRLTDSHLKILYHYGKHGTFFALKNSTKKYYQLTLVQRQRLEHVGYELFLEDLRIAEKRREQRRKQIVEPIRK